MSANLSSTSHQSILCILHFSPLLTKCILLEIFLVCLVSLPCLAIHTAELLSDIFSGASSNNITVSLLNNSLINILKYAKGIPSVHAEL